MKFAAHHKVELERFLDVVTERERDLRGSTDTTRGVPVTGVTASRVATISSLVAPDARASATACWKEAVGASRATVAATRTSAAVLSSRADSVGVFVAASESTKALSCTRDPTEMLLVLFHAHRLV